MGLISRVSSRTYRYKMSRRRDYEDDSRTHIAARQGDDCDMPVCESASDFSNAAKMFKNASKSSKPHDCPLNKEQLGNKTWSFLHTMAAYYPDKPTPEQQVSMNQFITSFSQFYPCKPCAKDFREDLGYFPVEENTGSRVDLSKYFCMLHNRVSSKLGRETEFDCSIENLDKRWRSNPECKK